jgi:hypothetical protein
MHATESMSINVRDSTWNQRARFYLEPHGLPPFAGWLVTAAASWDMAATIRRQAPDLVTAEARQGLPFAARPPQLHGHK